MAMAKKLWVKRLQVTFVILLLIQLAAFYHASEPVSNLPFSPRRREGAKDHKEDEEETNQSNLPFSPHPTKGRRAKT
jgi:hypothetical protein